MWTRLLNCTDQGKNINLIIITTFIIVCKQVSLRWKRGMWWKSLVAKVDHWSRYWTSVSRPPIWKLVLMAALLFPFSDWGIFTKEESHAMFVLSFLYPVPKQVAFIHPCLPQVCLPYSPQTHAPSELRSHLWSVRMSLVFILVSFHSLSVGWTAGWVGQMAWRLQFHLFCFPVPIVSQRRWAIVFLTGSQLIETGICAVTTYYVVLLMCLVSLLSHYNRYLGLLGREHELVHDHCNCRGKVHPENQYTSRYCHGRLSPWRRFCTSTFLLRSSPLAVISPKITHKAAGPFMPGYDHVTLVSGQYFHRRCIVIVRAFIAKRFRSDVLLTSRFSESFPLTSVFLSKVSKVVRVSFLDVGTSVVKRISNFIDALK